MKHVEKFSKKVIQYMMITRLPGREMNVLFAIFHQTFTQNRRSAKVGVTVIANCVGIDTPAASRALKHLLVRNIISYHENGMLMINDPEVWQTREPFKPQENKIEIVITDNHPCAQIAGVPVREFWGPDTSPLIDPKDAKLSDPATPFHINRKMYKYKKNKYKVTKEEYAEALAKVVMVYYMEKFHKKYGAERPLPLSRDEGAAAQAEIERLVGICPETYNYCYYITLINRNMEGGKAFLPAILNLRAVMEHLMVWEKVERKKNCPPGGCLKRAWRERKNGNRVRGSGFGKRRKRK